MNSWIRVIRPACGLLATASVSCSGTVSTQDGTESGSTSASSSPDQTSASPSHSTETVADPEDSERTLGPWMQSESPELDWDPALDCKAAKVSVGANHVCAITEGEHLFCWGDNTLFALGYVSEDDECSEGRCRGEPQPVGELHQVEGVSLGLNHTCALTEDGFVSCWGGNMGGSLGSAVDTVCANPWATDPSHAQELGCTPYPTTIPTLEDVVAIDGWGFQCALHGRDGFVSCWGGEGLNVPTLIDGVTEAREVDHFCALTNDNRIECWDRSTLGASYDWELPLRGLSTGYNTACAIDSESQVVCAGFDRDWNDGARSCLQGTPCALQVIDAVGDVVQISAGSTGVWLRREDGSVTAAGSSAPKALPAPAIDISAGYFGTCAVIDDGRIACWGGEFTEKQIGFGTDTRIYDLCEL